MRSLCLALLLCLGFASTAAADNIFVATNFPPAPFNAVNLFMSSPGSFGTATPFSPQPWVTTANTGNFLQLRTADLSTSNSLVWAQSYVGVGSSYQIAYQVGIWNGVSITGGFAGTVTLSPGQAVLLAPVPEPSSLVLCGLGAAALAVRARRRQRAAALACGEADGSGGRCP